MMREILFRGIDRETKQWQYGMLLTSERNAIGEYNAFIVHAFATDANVGEYEIIEGTEGQFTGLRDKNGMKIFEGDIVEIELNDRPSPYIDKLVCKFSNGGFNFFYKGIERILSVDITTYEVIGNTYQNPELLTTKP